MDLRAEFQAVVMANLDSLFGYARVLTRRTSDAEDLLQDVLLRAYRAFGSFDRKLSVKAWLFKIMKNAYIDRERRRRARPVEGEWANGDERATDEERGAHNREAKGRRMSGYNLFVRRYISARRAKK